MENVILPMLGETMNEGTISKWRKKEGDKIEKGEILLEITTDKATLEVESIVSGIVRKILAKEGEVIPVLQTIALVGDANEPIPEAISNIKGQKSNTKNQESNIKEEKTFQKETIKSSTDIPERIFVTPAAKRVAKELNINLADVKGTGSGGRITEEDVKKWTGKNVSKGKEIEQTQAGELLLTPMRKIIAKRMKESKTNAPHFYLKISVDMSNAVALRTSLLEEYKKKVNVKISYNDIIIYATAKVLEENPIINASFAEDKIILHKDINIGMAVSLDDGLIVPVIKNANKKALIEIVTQANTLVAKARSNKLLPNEYTGGTFTISNLGMYDIEDFSAIINPPESAILAIGKITNEVVAGNGGIFVKPMMNLTLSVDHRVIDGVTAAKFLQKLKQVLEDIIE
ncbi:MAG: dihydrolipoamide acetyltransferase family protein [Candidatus Firestonebacteria bacterium]